MNRPDRRRRRWVAGGVLVAALVVVVAGLANWPRAGLELWRSAFVSWYGAKTGVVAVDGQRIAWAEIGEGPPVVLIHGLRGELTVLLPLARELARRGYRVIALDLPGHGRSAAPRRPLDIDSAGRLLLDAAYALDLGERPVLVGHSMGGWIVAWQALAQPERCGPVVLVSSAGLPFDLPELPSLLTRTASDARRSIPLLFAEPPAFVPRPILWFAVQRPWRTSLDLLRSASTGRYLLDGLLEGLAVPALVVFGEQDRLIPPEVGRRLAAQLPGQRFAVIGDAGHMVVWEQPSRVAQVIDRFLDETKAGEDPIGDDRR